MASRHSSQKEWAKEKPIRAAAVRATLARVTIPAPNRRVIRSERRLERMVPMEMMMEIDKVEAELPGLDCGACGAPSCRAFAEDTVRGSCRKEDCVFILRKEIRRFADSLSNLDLDGGKRTSDDE